MDSNCLLLMFSTLTISSGISNLTSVSFQSAKQHVSTYFIALLWLWRKNVIRAFTFLGRLVAYHYLLLSHCDYEARSAPLSTSHQLTNLLCEVVVTVLSPSLDHKLQTLSPIYSACSNFLCKMNE